MYVTKRLSHLIKFPEDLNLASPEGPNSGILVIQDEESEPSCCFGLCKSERVCCLPFPQNKKLELSFASGFFPNRTLHFLSVSFIPVLNKPLSSNHYYAIQPYGKDRGEAFTNSKVEDMSTCCYFCDFGDDELPQRLDPNNTFQQVEIHRYLTGFVAKSVAPNGHPPKFLRKKGWRLDASTSPEFHLGEEALGLDKALRARLPVFSSTEPSIVGKWYCPFMFVKEYAPKTLKDKVSKLMFYEITLEQRWEKIFECEKRDEVVVMVDVVVETEVVTLGGGDQEVGVDERNLSDGFLWFRSNSNVGEETSVGLSNGVVERMKWEEERVGWVEGRERKVRIEREEKFEGIGEWRRFGCYLLVERFVLKRMDRNLVLSYDFRHTHQIRIKWE